MSDKPAASGFWDQSSKFFSYLAQKASEVFWGISNYRSTVKQSPHKFM